MSTNDKFPQSVMSMSLYSYGDSSRFKYEVFSAQGQINYD